MNVVIGVATLSHSLNGLACTFHYVYWHKVLWDTAVNHLLSWLRITSNLSWVNVNPYQFCAPFHSVSVQVHILS